MNEVDISKINKIVIVSIYISAVYGFLIAAITYNKELDPFYTCIILALMYSMIILSIITKYLELKMRLLDGGRR